MDFISKELKNNLEQDQVDQIEQMLREFKKSNVIDNNEFYTIQPLQVPNN
jgi:hypothetical protein